MLSREIILGTSVVVLLALSFFFPLRHFQRKQALRHFLFHFLFSGIVLGEVALLIRFNFFSGRFLELGSVEPFWLRVLLCILALDLLSYVWHRMNHSWAFLWRWHRFHHQTEVMDPLVAYRFHPIEVFLGYQLRAAVIWFLGFNANEIAIFILVYAFLNLLQHSNLRLPERVDALLAIVLVTPRLHHVHHLRDRSAQDSNYSTVFIFWDRLFRSYTAPQPIRENDIGLDWEKK